MSPFVLNNLALFFFCGLSLTTFFYYIVPKRWSLNVISFITLLFLGVASPLSCLWLTLTSLFVWGILKWNYKKISYIVGILSVISLAFLVSQYLTRFNNEFLPGSIVFLGIAYYTCRHIHVLIEVYKETIRVVSLEDYLNYQFFLPALLNGPIHRFPHFIRECQRRYFSWKFIFQGAERILYGYVKIILIGNFLLNLKLNFWMAENVSPGLGQQYMQSAMNWLMIYFVFSGYMDVALGFTKMWGMQLEENFNHPLLAKSLIEFWQRWHITLSTWCKDYIYFPALAYSRNAFLAVLLAMLGIGLWHQFSLYYVCWAIYQALGIVLCRMNQRFDFFNLQKFSQLLRDMIARIATWGWLISAGPCIKFLLPKLGL